MKKRVLSIILSFCMLLSMLPVTALAAQSMTITVQDSSGNPIEGATVVIQYRGWFSWNDVTSRTTDAQGTVSYSNNNNNRTYRVVVSADGYNTVTSETFSNSSNEITVTLTATGSSGSDTGDYFYYKFSENSSNSTLYYTTDGSTLQELGRGEELRLDRYAPVAFYVAIAPGYTSGSQFQQRSGSDKYEYDWKGGTYTPIDSLTTTSLGSGSNQINITAATELAKSTTYGCDYEFHYSATGTEYRYREFEITGTATSISVEYSVDGDTSVIKDTNNYRHPNVTDTGYANYLTQITIPAATPKKDGYTFVGWAFRGGIYRAGDTLQIKDLWSAEINTDVTYTFVAQWTANPSELTITKELSGGPTNLPTDFEITVTGSNGYSTTLDQNDEHIFSDGKYTWVLNNLTAATYTVTESGYQIDGYTLQMGGSTMSGSVYLNAGQQDEISLSNVYQINTYTITWVNEGGAELEKDENVPYGTTPSYDGETPTKAADGQYSYSFTGWSPTVAPVTGDVTYTAVFAPTTNTYTVTWVDEDGTTELEKDENVPYGTMPNYNGVTPTKASDAQYHYVFNGWSPAVSTVTGDVTYTATYRQGNVRTYTVIWHNYNREAIETDYNVPYGTEVKFDGSTQGNNYANCVSYGGETPTKPADSLNTYKFTGWKFYRGTALSSDGKVVGSVEFEPVFEAVPIPRVATVEVVLNGTANGEGQTDGTDQPSVTGTHADISQMIAGADDAIYLKLADGTGEYITLSKTATGVYSYSGIANGDYKIYTKVGTVYQQLGIQLIDIDNSNDTDYAPFYSLTYNDGEANGAAVNMPATEYYYVGSHVDVSSKVPVWTDHVFEYWFVDTDADHEWDEGESIYHPGTSQQDSHLDSSIAQAHTLTASWDDAAQVSVTVVVDHKTRATADVNESLAIHLLSGDGSSYNQVAGTEKTVEKAGWCLDSNTTGKTENGVTTYTTTYNAGLLYTDLSTANMYSASASISGYDYVKTEVSKAEDDSKYYVTVYLEYDPQGFELSFDVKIAADTPAGLVPASVDVRVTYWNGTTWTPIPSHETQTMEVAVTKASDGTYGGTGTAHVWAFSDNEDETPYLYRIEIVNLDAIGAYSDLAARAYYTVEMSSANRVDYTSGLSGFFPAGAYAATVEVGTSCNNGLSTQNGLYGSHAANAKDENENDILVQHDAITAHITVNPYKISLDLNYDDQDENTGTTFATIPDRFTVPVLDGYVPTREGHTFAGWYLSANGTGNRITGGEAINQLDTDLAVGDALKLYAKWDADFTVSGKVEADMGYPCQDTSRKVTVILQRKNAGGVYVDWKSYSAPLSTLNGTTASGEYYFQNVPADADYRIYVPHSAGIVTYQNELSTDYSANHYAVVRGTTDPTTAVVNVHIAAVKFDLGYMVDASAINAGYRPYNISISLCHDHNSEKYYELIETLPTIAALNENGKTEIATISVPQYHANGTLFNYVISTLTWQNSKVNNGETVNHVHHLNDAASRKTFAPFVIDYTGPANYSAVANSDGLNQSVTLKAIFKPNTYAINYNLNNGSWAVDGSAIRSHVWSYDTEITTTPVREGYVFNGWIASVTDGVEKKTDGTWVVPADIWTDVTLTAQWTPANYTITYHLDEGALPQGQSNPTNYTIESAGFTLVNPVREGYTFVGWTGTGLTEATKTVTIPTGSIGDREYTATWTIDSYDITVEVENGTASETGTISVNHGGNLTVTFTANTGYALDSVTVDGEVAVLSVQTIDNEEKTVYTFSNVTAAHSIKVVYATDTVLGSDNIPDKYQAVVTYMVANGSFAEDFTDKVKFTLKEYQNGVWNNVSPAPTLGDTIPVVGTHMVPDEGRTTEGSWNTVPTAETAVTRDYTYIWTFTGVQKLNVTYSDHAKYQNDRKTPEMSTAVVEYHDTIEVDPNGGSWTTNLVSGTESTYTQTRYVNVTEDSALGNPTRDYYIFIGWKWEHVSAVDLEGTFTAQWVPVEYAIRYHLDGGALSEGQSNPETYTIEDSFALVAPVKTGYVFEGWTGTGLSAATKEVSVSAGSVGDRAYTATWSAATNTPYTIKYYLEDLNADTFSEYTDAQVNCEGTTGATVSVDVSGGSADVNFKSFDGFTFDDDNTNNVCSGAIAADGSLELKLYYARNSYTVRYVNDDGTTVLQSTSAEYSAAVPGYTGSTPATTQSYKPAQYTCTFDGWTLESGTVGTGDTVVGNMTYKAVYTWTTNTYTVTWVDYDGNVLKTESVDYGTIPSYGGTPTREQDSQNSYEFSQWLDKENKLSEGKVVCDVTLTADYTPTARLFTGYAEIYLEVNGVDTLTDVETLLGTGVKLYFSADESTYYELSRNDGKYSNSSMPNGNYKLYSSADGNTYSKVCDQILVIYGSTATAKEYFHAVTYDANGGSGGPDSPAYYHEGSAVTVSEPAPVFSGYLFQGWWYDADGDSTVDVGETYQAGDVLTNGIYQNYALTAQWKKDTKATVNLTVTIDHSADGGVDPSATGSLTIDLVRKDAGAAGANQTYVTVSGQRKTETYTRETVSGTENLATSTTQNFNRLYSELSTDYDYALNVFLDGYQLVVEQSGVESETDADGNKTYNVTIKLKYNPDLFNLVYNVVVDESVPDDAIPSAVDVKVISYDANVANNWAPISSHVSKSAEVTITNRQGSGSYSVPVHKNTNDPYLYSVAVAGFTIGGKELYVDRAGSIINYYPSVVTDDYAAGAYYAEVSLSFTNDQDAKDGSYGHGNNHTAPFHQHGTLTITIKTKTYDVELDLNYDGDDTGSENDILTVIEDQFRIPADIQTNAVYQPTREGYTFEGWYTDAACTDGNEVFPGTVLTQNVTLYAKWKSKLTVSGNIAIAGAYSGGTIHFADRPTSVIVTLYRKAPGSSHAVEYGTPVTVTIDNGTEDVQKNPGTGSYEFKNLPNDGSTYHIAVLARNFMGTFWNEELTTGETEYDKYTAASNTAFDGNNNNTATVHAYLIFTPQTFDLDWEINASAIGEGYRPTKASTLVMYDDSAAAGYTWAVITQQIQNGVEAGQESDFDANGISVEDYDVWQFHSLGHAYNYAIRLQSIIYKLDGSTETTVTDFANAPFSISYVYPAFYKATTGDQDILLTATLTPKSYTVTLDANGGTVNGKGSDTVAHTWSKPTQITAIPVREGYVFSGWTANVSGVYDGANISAAVRQNVTLTAQWIEIQSVTFTGESGTVTYNGGVQSLSGMTVTGLPNGYTHNVTYTVSGFVGSDDSDSVDITGNVTYTGDAVDAVNAGTYTITPVVSGLSAANYTFKAANGTLIIDKANLTIKAADKTKVFDGQPFGRFTYSATGFVDGEDASVLSGTVSYNEEAVNATAAGTYDIIPNVTGLSADNYTFIAEKGILTILEDSNGDGVADQNQKKVTFKVVNGTWGDGTTEKVVYVTLDASGVGTLLEPTDMIPDAGYANGVWENEPPTTISKADDLPTYVYKYSLITGLSYTVNYLVKGTDTAIHAQKIQDGKTYGDTVEAANEIITVTGYSYDSADASALTIGTGENVLNLYYVKNELQTHSVSAQVQYFFGDTLTEAKAKTTADAIEEVVTASGWIGDTVTVTVAPNTTDKFAGYQHGTTEGALSYSVAAGEASDTVTHVVKVYYIKNTEHTHSVSVQVQYFFGDTPADAQAKTVPDATEEAVTASGWIGEAVTVTVTANTTDKFRGYKYDSTEGELSYSIEANADDANYVVKVYYVKDEGQTHSVSAQVQYFYGETLADAQAKTVPDAIEDVVTASSWIEEEVTVAVTVDTNNKFTGYAHKSIQGDLSYTLAPGEAGSSAVNVVKVYHVKDPTQTKTLSYTVEYYKAGVKVEGDTQTVAETVWVNAPDTLTVAKSGINIKDKYSGYKLSHTDPTTIPDEIVDGGVIKVYYVKDETKTKELSYTVKYYKDDVLVEDDTQVERKTVWMNDSNSLTVDKSRIDAENKYVGYKLDTVKTAEIPDTIVDDDVIEIYYVRNNDATKTLSYTVEYFKDGVLADTQVEYQDVWVNAEAVLDVDISKINTTNKYVGYKYDSIVPATIPAKINNGDVIKVYYILDTTQTHSVSAQVQYFYGETLEKAKEKTIADASDAVITESGWIGETVTVTVTPNTTDQFIGYKHGGTEGELSYSVVAGAASDTVTHVVKVYYVKDAEQTKELSYTVEYYKDGEKADAQTVSKAAWVNDSSLPVDKSAINTTDKYDGYKFVSTDPSPIPDTIAGGGVIKVNYVKDDGKTKVLSYTVEYYKDGEKADTQTVTKAVWVNDSSLPVDKSAINTTDKYDGYKFVSTDPSPIPDTIAGGGVIKVNYVKDDGSTKTLSYTVEYYKDGVKADSEIVSKNVWINDLDTMEVDKSAINTTNKYVGYSFSATEPAEIPDVIANGGVIKVFYKKNYVPPIVDPDTPVITTGTAKLVKVDADDQSSYLKNVVFELYKADGTLLGEYKTDANGQITVSSVVSGAYYWLETRPAEGYVLDSTKHSFTVSAGQTATLTVTNKHSEVPSAFSGDHYAYIVGYSDGKVHPEANITRAEVATIFFRLLDNETRERYITKENTFSDVENGMWFNTAVSTMAAMGIINGYPDGDFHPNANITRAEFAAIAARFDSNANTTGVSFTDIYGHWAQKEINIAANNGWILGYENGEFRPNQNITRAEAMAMVNRVLQRIPESKEDLLDAMIKWSDNMDTTKWYYLAVQEATNSHDYGRKNNGYEYWTTIKAVPDWAALER